MGVTKQKGTMYLSRSPPNVQVSKATRRVRRVPAPAPAPATAVVAATAAAMVAATATVMASMVATAAAAHTAYCRAKDGPRNKLGPTAISGTPAHRLRDRLHEHGGWRLIISAGDGLCDGPLGPWADRLPHRHWRDGGVPLPPLTAPPAATAHHRE